MKKQMLNLLIAISIFSSCEKEQVLEKDNSNYQELIIDSIFYDIKIITNANDIISMDKFHEGELVEKITLIYSDSIVIKKNFINDTLSKKRIYHFEGNNYATFSIDSFFSEDRYFKTYYTYNNEGYLTEEKHIPGVYSFISDSAEYTTFEYSVFNGNIYKTEFLLEPPNTVSTGFDDYKYSENELKLDIINFNNSIIGKPNKNLPKSFGYQMDIRPGTFVEKVKYDYEINNSFVTKRIDSYIKSDTIVRKEILLYSYN